MSHIGFWYFFNNKNILGHPSLREDREILPKSERFSVTPLHTLYPPSLSPFSALSFKYSGNTPTLPQFVLFIDHVTIRLPLSHGTPIYVALNACVYVCVCYRMCLFVCVSFGVVRLKTNIMLSNDFVFDIYFYLILLNEDEESPSMTS